MKFSIRTVAVVSAVGMGTWMLTGLGGQQRAGAAPGVTTAPGAAAPAAAGRGAGRARGGGRGGIPGATARQTAAVAQITRDTATLLETLGTLRGELLAAELSWPADPHGVAAKLAAVMAAEQALAQARAAGLATLQHSEGALAQAQVAALSAGAGAGPTGVRGTNAIPPVPHMTSKQVAALTAFTGSVQAAAAQVAAARTAVAAAALGGAATQAPLAALQTAEDALAAARTAGLAKLQNSPDKLDESQLAALLANGGVLTSGAFDQPRPYDFDDDEGYVSLFDGKTLKGWDGNPKFWRVEEGAIVGESTAQNPSGNTYIAYRDMTARDFTLKFEIKTVGAGGSGLQYRSKTGVPWLTPVQPNVIANTGPVNLDWMMTGPQADFWPVRVYTGQFYSENTPMRIMAWRGQVVEGAGMAPRHLMGTIGDRTELGKLVKNDDWNQYIVIARGGVLMHIVNGQLMAVMVDDDPDSSNNQAGLFGIEIEATTKVSVRNVWVKKID